MKLSSLSLYLASLTALTTADPIIIDVSKLGVTYEGK